MKYFLTLLTENASELAKKSCILSIGVTQALSNGKGD